MIKKDAIVIVCVLFLFPLPAYSSGQEKGALTMYMDALSKGDSAQLSSLLSPEFEYRYYKGTELKILNRAEELSALRRLIHDAAAHGFNEPDLFERDEKRPDTFHIRFLIIFEDSPKVHTESLFRGAVLEINEKLSVLLKGNKIVSITEAKEARRKNRLSFGYLKSLYLKNTEVLDKEVETGWVFELRDKDSRTLLLTKKSLAVRQGYVRNIYYWPDNRKIENFL